MGTPWNISLCIPKMSCWWEGGKTNPDLHRKGHSGHCVQNSHPPTKGWGLWEIPVFKDWPLDPRSDYWQCQRWVLPFLFWPNGNSQVPLAKWKLPEGSLEPRTDLAGGWNLSSRTQDTELAHLGGQHLSVFWCPLSCLWCFQCSKRNNPSLLPDCSCIQSGDIYCSHTRKSVWILCFEDF